MSKMKTALEIALERAEGIETDPQEERREELIARGKRIAGSFLFDIDTSYEHAESQLDQTEDGERELVRQGIRETILANMSLPQTDLYVEDLGNLKKLAGLLSEDPSSLDDLFVQIDNLYGQYLQTREQMENRLLEQYRPQLEQKQRRLQQQTGQRIELRPEQDNEFVGVLQDAYKRLDAQFQGALDDLKQQLSSFTN